MQLRALAFVCVLACVSAPAQDANNLVKPAETPAPAPNHGWSWYTTYAESHDNQSGWVSEVTSEIRWDVNDHWSFELGAPAYFVKPFKDTNYTVTGKTTTTNGTAYNEMGDIFLHINFAHSMGWLDYSSTLAGTGPTGDTDHNISTGHATVDWNNHFEHGFTHVSPFVEAGMGNSSNSTRIFKRPYTTSGFLTHYRAGFTWPLFKSFSFETAAYDNLGFGDQTLYSRIVPRKGLTKQQLQRINRINAYRLAANAAGNSGLAADHGFSGTLSRSLGSRTDFQVGYTRSIIQHLDQVTMTIGFRVGHVTKQSQADQSQ